MVAENEQFSEKCLIPKEKIYFPISHNSFQLQFYSPCKTYHFVFQRNSEYILHKLFATVFFPTYSELIGFSSHPFYPLKFEFSILVFVSSYRKSELCFPAFLVYEFAHKKRNYCLRGGEPYERFSYCFYQYSPPTTLVYELSLDLG